MSIDSVSTANATTTSRGTKIVKPGTGMDKEAFLRILTAELSNQDPTQNQDSTQYVAQMAQFSSLEEMSNLNTSSTMTSANSMIGKEVLMNTLDENGNPYSGIVKVVSRQGSNVTLGVEVNSSGTTDIKEFSYDDVQGVSDDPSAVDNGAVTNSYMQFLTEATMIGKKAEFSVQDANGKNYSGVIQGIVKNGSTFDLTVLLDGTTDTKDLPVNSIIKLNNPT
jgi:flagellar basal-body rod modification protein FlgD